MSGHSKWATIKRQKGANDQKRGLVFSKLSNAITIAVREGGGITDPTMNFKLRLAVDKAKEANMPKENIERAIDRAKGGQGGLEEIVYEGYGPAGIALMVAVATDNRARTLQSIKAVFDRHGGTMGDRGAVSYLFSHQGMISADKGNLSEDDIFTIVVESAASDFELEGDTVDIYTPPEKLHEVQEYLHGKGISIKDSELVMRPMTIIPIDEAEKAKKILNLMEALEDLEDVQHVYSNFNIHDSALALV